MSNCTTSKHLVRLLVLYTHAKDGTPYTEEGRLQPYKKLNRQGLLRMERHLVKRVGHWKYAFVVPAGGSLLRLWYYLPSQVVNKNLLRLTKEQYVQALRETQPPHSNYFLWIIPKTTYKIQINNHRAQTATVDTLDEIASYFKWHILRIDIYQGNCKIGHYDQGGLSIKSL